MSIELHDKNLELLGEKWNEIETRVIIPLWNGKFKQRYENIKLDYDDFLSLAGYELTKAMSTYDSEKSNILTFATNVINKKALTEIRNYELRDKRRGLSSATSLNVPVDGEEGTEFINTIKDEITIDEDPMTEVRVGGFLKSLSNRQLRVLILKLLEFDEKDIADMLSIPKSKVKDAIKGLSECKTVSPLYMRGE